MRNLAKNLNLKKGVQFQTPKTPAGMGDEVSGSLETSKGKNSVFEPGTKSH